MNQMTQMNQAQLLHWINMVSFAVVDITEYLDTHPTDQAALKKRAQLQAKRCELVEEYESKYGPYIVTDQDVCGDVWTWVAGPWPWECERGNGHVAV